MAVPSIFRVYLLNKSSVSVELTAKSTCRDVCLQLKRRIGIINDADYGLFGTSTQFCCAGLWLWQCGVGRPPASRRLRAGVAEALDASSLTPTGLSPLLAADWSAESRIYIPDDRRIADVFGKWPPDALMPGGARVRKLVYRRRMYLPNSGKAAARAAFRAFLQCTCIVVFVARVVTRLVRVMARAVVVSILR
jgi:hypothetical protein